MTIIEGKLNDFERPAEGIHTMSLDEIRIELQKDKADQYNAIFSGVLVDVEEEMRMKIFCPLDKKFGIKKAMFVLFYSGISGEIAKEAGKQDLDKIDWEAKDFGANEKIWASVATKIEMKVKTGQPYLIQIELQNQGKFQNIIDIKRADTKMIKNTVVASVAVMTEKAPF
jgi:hypothetical protein